MRSGVLLCVHGAGVLLCASAITWMRKSFFWRGHVLCMDEVSVADWLFSSLDLFTLCDFRRF